MGKTNSNIIFKNSLSNLEVLTKASSIKQVEAKEKEILKPTQILMEQWFVVKKILELEIGPDYVKSWIEPLTLTGIKETTIVLESNNSFSKNWIEDNYLKVILNAWKKINMLVSDLQIIVEQKENISSPSSKAEITNINTESENLFKDSDILEDLEKNNYTGAVLDSRFTFDNFIVGKPNELAYAAAFRVAESKTAIFNPLFLYGGVGLGKTHLMHAIAWKIRKDHPKRKVVYLSAEKFMYQFVKALRFKDTVSFKEQFRSVDVLMIDDVQFISGKDSTQEEFFHTFNALVDKNHQIIISADKSPSDLENMEERLKSRLGWGLVADLHPTTYELRLSILQNKAEQMQCNVPKDVLEFLAIKIASNIRELEGSLNRIIAHSQLIHRAISLEMSQEVLRDLLRSNDLKITIEDIQKKVAEYFNIKMADMVSNRRMQNIARPRQVAMFLAKQLTTKSLPEIGKKFGGRDHTTIIHAIKKIQELIGDDFELSNDIELLKRAIQN